MTTIYLKYGNYDLSNVLTWENAQAYSASTYIKKKRRTLVGGETLRDSRYQHVKGKGNYYSIVLNADQLSSSTKMTYLENFFIADAIQISTDNVTYIDVIWEADKLEPEFVSNSKYLPKVSLELIEV